MAGKKKEREAEVRLERRNDPMTPFGLWNRDLPFSPRALRTPFTMMRRFADDFEPLFQNLRPYYELPGTLERTPFEMIESESEEWTPRFEMFEADGKFIVRAELPGMTRDDIVVEINDNFLTLKGRKENKFEEEKEGFFRSEFRYGDFCRRMPLPEGVKTEGAKAVFRDGVLEVALAAPDIARKTRRLEITEAEPKAMKAVK